MVCSGSSVFALYISSIHHQEKVTLYMDNSWFAGWFVKDRDRLWSKLCRGKPVNSDRLQIDA